MLPRQDAVSELIRRVGFRKARKIMSFMLAWAHAERAIGHPPTIEEVTAFWHQGLSTTYRELALFKDAFPNEADPSRMWHTVWAAQEQSDTELLKLMDGGDQAAGVA